MDVERIDNRHVLISGTALELGYIADGVDVLRAVSQQGEALGHVEGGISEFQAEVVKGRLTERLPNREGIIRARFSNDMAEIALRGAEVARAECEKMLALWGKDGEPDGLRARKRGFALAVSKLVPVVDEVRLEIANGQ